MGLLKKEKIKDLLLVWFLILLLGGLIGNALLMEQNQKMKQELNKVVSAIVGTIVENDPEIEKEIIQQLSTIEEQSVDKGREILELYGIDTDKMVAATNLEKEIEKNRMTNMIFLGSIGILLLLSFVIYLKNRDRKIKEITKYLKEIQRKQYHLKIEENTEGELSHLKNEIYKITVMLKEQAEQLLKDKTYLSDSISDISHQIKTPLTSISVMLDVLKENSELPKEKKQEFLFEVSRQIEWIKWLVISLLKLSKLDTGTAELRKEKVEVKKLLSIVIQNLSIPIEIKNQKITIEGEEEASYLGDFNWSVEAVVNIVKNCMEHTEEGKEIKIRYEENALFTEIIIQDSGEGIAKEDLPNIFKRFYKGKNAKEESFGIGLALAKAIVENQGGDIVVKSKKEEGSTFTIKFYKGIR